MSGTEPFPICGIVGILSGENGEADRVLSEVASNSPPGLGGLEIRADLFPTLDEAVAIVEEAAKVKPVLFTVRLKSHGGRFDGDEKTRVRAINDALDRGAGLVDAEWGSEASRQLAQTANSSLVVSHHDFNGMISDSELRSLTREAESLRPAAVKVVPTATSPSDSLRMLQWVSSARDDGPRRVGFAMGELGALSRILSVPWGAPFTYAAFGEAVAPGQISVREMGELYRTHELSAATRIFGVIGNPVGHSLSPHIHNPSLASRGIDAVYLPLALNEFEDFHRLVEPLGIDGVSVTIPFKGEACQFASFHDDDSLACGASNTLVRDRTGKDASKSRFAGWNTDVEGVVGPLRRRNIELDGLTAAILGNGGAARGAVRALVQVGVEPTIYYRSEERGAPVAAELGVPSRHLSELSPGSHGMIVNATPLGLKAGDPSPVPPKVFNSSTIAFDMIYDPPETPFLAAAASGGADLRIAGREMLICQGIVQFQLFTGKAVSYAEFEMSFLKAQKLRYG